MTGTISVHAKINKTRGTDVWACPRTRRPMKRVSQCARSSVRLRRHTVWACLQCLLLHWPAACSSGHHDTQPPERPGMREFAFASRAQDRGEGVGSGCVRGADGFWWSERGAAMLAEGSSARDSLRSLQLAVRLGCRAAFVYQDMAVARLAMQDVGGALSDVRRALQLAGCNTTADTTSNSHGCERPELLLNYASLLDKAYPSHGTLHTILHVLRSYVGAACSTDAFGVLSCRARGAIAAIVEMWRLGQLSFSNWDTWHQDQWLLEAAVEADVQRCRTDEARLRYSVVQPWEVRRFQLALSAISVLVAHVARIFRRLLCVHAVLWCQLSCL
jgi:hypothetical protein